MRKFARLNTRTGGKGSDAWDIHFRATELQQQGQEAIILTVGQELDGVAPGQAVDVAIAGLHSRRYMYSDINGEVGLRRAIAENFTRESGVAIDETNCAIFSGAQNSLFTTSLCILETGDEVILIEPFYVTYPATFTVGGAKLVQIPTGPQNNFQFDPDMIRSRITRKTKAIVMNSPNNPSGIVYDWESVKELAKICEQNGIWLISDEVYSTLAEPGTHRSPASVPGGMDFCITISSISKSHRMPGWRIGWVIANDTLIHHLNKLSLCMAYGFPQFIQDAAEAAIRHTDQISPVVRSELNRKRKLVISRMENIEGVAVQGSNIGMFVILDVEGIGLPAIQFAEQLFNEHRVALLPCDPFGDSCGQYLLRISVGEAESKLITACERIEQFVSEYRKRTWKRV